MDIKPKIGITAGAFDLLTPGHCLMLEEVKKHCNYLIVALHTNPQIDRKTKNRPIETTYERYIRLSSSKFVDKIIPYDTERDLEVLLNYTDYDIRFLSTEYKDKDFTGKDIKPDKHFFNSRTHNYSSSDLRARIFKAELN